jgi:predicted RNA polymerase sigma factor
LRASAKARFARTMRCWMVGSGTLAFADGPAAGLALVDSLAAEPSLRSYHLLPGVRGDLLMKLGRREEARAEIRARGIAHA